MSEPTSSAGDTVRPTTDEDQEIRGRVRELTSQLFQQGRINSQDMQDVMRAVTGAAARDTGLRDAEARQAFADFVKGLAAALASFANAAHLTLDHLAARGKDFSDNDLKDALLSLRSLQVDYVAVVTRIADAAGSSLRRDFADLAARVQSVGADATAGIATSMSEFANRFSENAASGLEVARGASVRMALLASGVLKGVADALREQAPRRTEANRSRHGLAAIQVRFATCRACARSARCSSGTASAISCGASASPRCSSARVGAALGGRRRGRAPRAAATPATRVRGTRPDFIKLGQMLSTREDLLRPRVDGRAAAPQRSDAGAASRWRRRDRRAGRAPSEVFVDIGARAVRGSPRSRRCIAHACATAGRSC